MNVLKSTDSTECLVIMQLLRYILMPSASCIFGNFHSCV